MVKPVARMNHIRQLVLAGLSVSPTPARGLAQHVSWPNVDRLAARWSPHG